MYNAAKTECKHKYTFDSDLRRLPVTFVLLFVCLVASFLSLELHMLHAYVFLKSSWRPIFEVSVATQDLKTTALERIILLNICTILHILYILTSAVKWLIVINCIQNKSLPNMCVYCVYSLCKYKYTHIPYIFWKYLHAYIFTHIYIIYIYINNIFMKYTHACVYLYKHNKYTQYTCIYYVNITFILDVINHLTALILT